MTKRTRAAGVYRKFKITRTDGAHRRGGKHDGCAYFVLDLTHDPFALPALAAYAEACAKEFPALAGDLRQILATPQHQHCGCREAMCAHFSAFGPQSPGEALAEKISKPVTK